MWEIKNEKMRLDISKVSSNFRIVSEDGLHLICPKKNMWDWEEEEKWLRSIVIDNNGFVVSCAWKKFGNYGEFQQDKKILDDALKNGEIIFSHKEDGSLCIRSVINGKVVLRTRGTLFGGIDTEEQVSYGERFKIVSQIKYPILLDPSFMTDRSLLFEYVASSNQVVVRYKEEDLIFLGFVKHDNLEIGRWKEVEKISQDNKFNLVRIHNLPNDPIQLLEEVKDWKDEGVVVRCNDDQTFVKVKSAWYLANHRLKFSMTYGTIVEFIELENIHTEEELVEKFKSYDYDWELIISAQEFYHRYIKVKELKNNIINTVENFIKMFRTNFQNIDEKNKRKEFALSLVEKNFNLPMKFVRPIAFLLYDNKVNKLESLCRKFILTEGQ